MPFTLTQSPPFQVPLVQPQDDNPNLSVVAFRAVPASEIAPPYSDVDVASYPRLGTLPGRTAGSFWYTVAAAALLTAASENTVAIAANAVVATTVLRRSTLIWPPFGL
jgi:hypothetical protein